MLNWGVLSTGRIASTFTKGLLASQTGKLVAVASRTQAEADKFGIEKHGDFLKNVAGVTRYGSYEAMLADKNVQAVYIATPHPMHATWAIRAAEAGKHVLCEKPIGLNHAEAMTIFEAARAHGVFAMEAYMYRCHPMMAKIVELVKSGAIGQVRAIQATFAFNAGANWTGRLLANELAGGGILDVGGYPMSFARAVAGAALGLDGPAEPADLKAVGQLTQTGVDGYTAAVVKFNSPWGGIVANLATGVQVNMDNTCRVYGVDGHIIFDRWVPGEKDNKVILVKGKDRQEIVCDGEPGHTAYTMEADTLARGVAAGEKQAKFPAMSWGDTLGNMKALDAWRAQIGLTYESEKPAKQMMPINGRPLAVAAGALMKYGKIEGVSKPISRLIMGVDNQTIDRFPHATAMFDDYFSRGGNAFDSAFIYGGGGCEKALGQWVKNRNVREKVVILDKGVHTPHCDPQSLTSQLLISLERLQTSYLDIYVMHRDNPEVPVGEFVEVLNEHVKAGRIHAFGGSNWTKERVDAFIAYAKAHNLRPMAATSNNLALAVMVDAVWAGCLTANSPEYLAWHEKLQMPILPWSSQARGFFVVGDPAYKEDRDLARCWYSADNFERLKRAKELAAKKGFTPIQIALAWVLNQPFPTFALIGPRQIEETRTSFEALRVELTPAEVKWLNLQA